MTTETPAHRPPHARIAELRTERGWSQAVLARKIGGDAPQVTRYESGQVTPSTATVVRLAHAFDVTTDYLLRPEAPRRSLRGTDENSLDDRSSALSELSEGDLALVTGVVDALVAKTRLAAPRPLRTSSYPPDLRNRAVRLVCESLGDHPSEFEAIRAVAADLGIGSAETLRRWVRHSTERAPDSA